MRPAPSEAPSEAARLAAWFVRSKQFVLLAMFSEPSIHYRVESELLDTIRRAPASQDERDYIEHEVWSTILALEDVSPDFLVVPRSWDTPSVALDKDDLALALARRQPRQNSLYNHVDIGTNAHLFVQHFEPAAVRAWLLENADHYAAGWIANGYRDRLAQLDESLDPGCDEDARILALCED